MVDPRLAVAAAVSVMLFVSGWMVRGWYEAENKFQLEQKLNAAQVANDKLKTELGVRHEAERQTIAGLSDELRGLRLRLPKGCVQPNPAGGSSVQTTGAGEFPTAPQEAFDRFNGELAKLAKDADEVVATCRVVIDWAKAQGQ